MTTTKPQQPHDAERTKPYHYSYMLWSVILFTAVPWIADFLYGYDCGAISYTILQLRDDDLSGVSWGDNLSASVIGMIVSAAALGAFVASSWIVQHQEHRQHQQQKAISVGYVGELQAGALLYILGALLQVSSSFLQQYHTAIAALILGRFVYGLGIGVSMHAAPAYLGEMAPSRIRGFVLSMKEAANTVGVLTGYQIGHVFSSVEGGWINCFLISTLFAFASLVISALFLPESARWLLLRDKDEAAKGSLRFLYRDPETVEAVYSKIKNHLMQRRQQDTTKKPVSSLWDPANRHALTIGVGIVALQQLTGSPAMLAYASTVFKEAGQASNSSVHMAMFQLFVTLIAVGLVDRSGRRLLLLLGCSAMSVALAVLIIAFGRYDRAVLLAMFVYIGGFQLGFGPIAWLVVAEVFSNELRGKATALCVQINFSTYGLVQFAVPVVTATVGFSGAFAVFAALSIYR